jgi:hypothetical protein
MAITRRRVMVEGAIFLGMGRYLFGEPSPIELAFPNLELDPELPLLVGANTSGYNKCQIEVFSSEKQTVWRSAEWSTEPNRSNSASTARLGGQGTKNHTVRAVLRPTRDVTPGVAIAVHQGTDLDKTQIEKLAEEVRFVADPAHLPNGPAQGPIGGHFQVMLYRDSSVKVQIWSGNYARGMPLYQKQSHNVAAGSNPVPWDLHTTGGFWASPGRYIALLTCTPNEKGRAATYLGSSFGVV